MDRVKLIRDVVLGDGSIYVSNPYSNCGAILSISHCLEQAVWIDMKYRWLLKCGIVANCYQDKGGKDAWRCRTSAKQEFRRFWDEWYFFDTSTGRYEKDYSKLLLAASVDETTLAILFLDNGSRGIKTSYKEYGGRRRWEIEPYIERFKISVGKRKQAPIIAMLASFGIESLPSREGTGNGEVCIGKNESKIILKNIVRNYCVKNGLTGTFDYKYNYPLTMKDVKRLSELAPGR